MTGTRFRQTGLASLSWTLQMRARDAALALRDSLGVELRKRGLAEYSCVNEGRRWQRPRLGVEFYGRGVSRWPASGGRNGDAAHGRTPHDHVSGCTEASWSAAHPRSTSRRRHLSLVCPFSRVRAFCACSCPSCAWTSTATDVAERGGCAWGPFRRLCRDSQIMQQGCAA